jgi:nanoRNase/pAp phosphatase (c-di-AMP/oligoRNAs hydrolase)
MMPPTIQAAGRSGQLLAILSDYTRFTIVTHDNPDPDAIATGWGIATLIEERLDRGVRVVGGGAITRAENRHMVELLGPPIELVDDIPHDEDTAVVLVDCGLGTSNHLVTRQAIRPVAVIDHHGQAAPAGEVPFIDLRPEVAASASIAAQYLGEQEVEPGHKLATAMLYAIRTETRGFETHYTDLDRSVVLWLTERADPALLAEIESAPLSRAYFSDLVFALESTLVFGDTAFCLLPKAEGAEIVGELADLLIRGRGICRVLSGAVVDGDLLVSVRTERERDSAAQLVQTVLEGLGTGGGHTHRAGGKVPHVGGASMSDQLKNELRRRWLAACGLEARGGAPLIAQREIVDTLARDTRKRPSE